MVDQPPHVHSFLRGAQLWSSSIASRKPAPPFATASKSPASKNKLHAAGEMGELLASLGAAGEMTS